MKSWDLIRIANRNLFRNKLRTFLTVAAIFVGSFTLTMTNGIGDGMRGYVESQVKNIEGDSIVFVRRKNERAMGVPQSEEPPEYKETTEIEQEDEIDPNTLVLTTQQMENALAGVDGVKSVTPRYNIKSEYIGLNGEKKYRSQVGMLSDGLIQKTEVGSTITGSGQIVLPLGLARALDPNIQNLVGKKATVGYKLADGEMKTIELEIVGVATKGFQTNSSSFVDSKTAEIIYAAQRTDPESDKFMAFTLQMQSTDLNKILEVKNHLDERGFSTETVADMRKRTYDAIGIVKIGLNLFALIALLAASFGIINTLVIAVLERTKEIGLQKALGMGRGKIFAIFSLESVLIGFWGALLGTLGGIAVGLIANKVLITAYAESFEGFSLFAFTIPSITTVMALVCSIAFVAGVMPAFRASRLNPIESLRYE